MRFLFITTAALSLQSIAARRGKSTKSTKSTKSSTISGGDEPGMIADVAPEDVVRPLTSEEEEDVAYASIHQVWVGNSDDCSDGSEQKKKHTLNRLVGVYTDPDSGKMECFRDYDVDACYEQLIALGCIDGIATIDLYATDNSFDKSNVVENPNLKRQCGLTRRKKLKYTKKVTVNLTCGQGDSNILKACKSTEDCPNEDEYCGFTPTEGSICEKYAAAGESCGGVGIPGTQGICNPTEAYCDEDICQGAAGVCVMTTSCTSDKDCASGEGLACQNNICVPLPKPCAPPIGENENPSDGNGDPNDESLYCDSDNDCFDQESCVFDPAIDGRACTRRCNDDGDCFNKQYCMMRENDDESTCQYYFSFGAKCSGSKQCDPTLTYCFAPQLCNNSEDGECVGLGPECETDGDCDDRSYCDTSGNGRCKAKRNQGDCCDLSTPCADGLMCPLDEEFPVCTRSAIGPNVPIVPEGCQTDTDCDTGEFCSPSTGTCNAYAKLGDECSLGNPGIMDPIYCDPAGSYCQDTEHCANPKSTGICVVPGADCVGDDPNDTSTSSCEENEYCDGFHCLPKLGRGDCCETTAGCKDGLECEFNSLVEGPFCLSPEDLEEESKCEADADCAPSQYCTPNSKICKSYASSGEPCGGNIREDRLRGVCDGKTFCRFDKSCIVADVPGVCVRFGSRCSTDGDCAGQNKCDLVEGRCIPRLEEGACCSAPSDCLSGLECAGSGPATVCTSSPAGNPQEGQDCSGGLECENGFCGIRRGPPVPGESDAVCQRFREAGESCSGNVQGFPGRCDPSTAFCHEPESCSVPDASGECQLFGSDCSSDNTECEDGFYCDVAASKCKPAKEEGDCCKADSECDAGLTCPPTSEGNFQFCVARDAVSPGFDEDECSVDGDCENGFCGIRMGPPVPGKPDAACQRFREAGESCSGNVQGFPGRCDPSTAFCHEPESCSVPDASGECQLFGSDCSSDNTECEDGFYCDVAASKCKPAKEEGDCCKADSECDAGLTCPTDTDPFQVCVPEVPIPEGEGPGGINPAPAECETTEDCLANAYCFDADGPTTCVEYVSVGDSCGGYVVGAPNVCDPNSAFCDTPQSCLIQDPPGECVALGPACGADGDPPCKGESYCDGENCRPTKGEEACCQADVECSSDLTCPPVEQGPQVCSNAGPVPEGGDPAVGFESPPGRPGGFGTMMGGTVTVPKECQVDGDCSQKQWCAKPSFAMNRPGDNDGPTAVCLEYVAIGDTCGGYVPGAPMRCNPVKDSCYYPRSCVDPDSSGTCRPLGLGCNASTPCDADSLCQDQRCEPKKAVEECCEADEECMKDLVCSGSPGLCTPPSRRQFMRRAA